VIITTEFLDAAVLTIIKHASATLVGPLSGALFGLFTNDIGLTKTTAFSALTEPTYTGYAQQAATWSAATRDSNSNINIESQLLIWQEITTPVSVTIFGWFLVDSGGTNLLMAERFNPGPLSLVDLLSIIKFVVEFIQTNPNNAGQATLVP